MLPILLINPPETLDQAIKPARENISIGYLLAILRANDVPVVFLDAEMECLTLTEIQKQVLAHEYSGIVIPLMFRTLLSSQKIMEEIRLLSKAPIIGYDYVATLYSQQILERNPSLDAVICGESEQTLLDLARRWQAEQEWRDCPGICFLASDGTLQVQTSRDRIFDLDTLPFPSRDTLRRSLQNSPVVEIQSSRGCYGSCTFCNIRPFFAVHAGPAWRGRSPRHVVDEIEKLFYDFQVDQFEFADDCFIGPGEAGRQRAQQIAELILQRRLPVQFRIFCRADQVDRDLFSTLKKAGLCLVNLGVESSSNACLRRIRKGLTTKDIQAGVSILRELDIAICPSFILFEPWMDLVELEENLDYLEQQGFWNCLNPTTMIPFQQTEMMNQLSQANLLSHTEYIFEPYIPVPLFAYPQVGQVHQAWEAWRDECETKFRGLDSGLEMIYQAMLDPAACPTLSQAMVSALLPVFFQWKQLELGLVRRLIKESRQGLHTKPDFAQEQKAVYLLHQQFRDRINGQ